MSKIKIQPELLQKATMLGATACAKGMTKAPGHDSELMSMIEQTIGFATSTGHKERCKLMDAWSAGWIVQSLNK